MGANTVRLYNIDPRESHEKFMKKALSLGLYDYGNVGNNVLAFAKTVMKEFAQYNNTLMFTAANELAQLDKTLGPVPAQLAGRISVVTKGIKPQWKVACAASAIVSRNGYAAFPCVKAFVRDLHNHQAECNSTMRRVPLIYSDVDTGGGAARKVVADYLTCALDSEADAVDAYGLNVYSWCDDARAKAAEAVEGEPGGQPGDMRLCGVFLKVA
eukprot:g30579.t1